METRTASQVATIHRCTPHNMNSYFIQVIPVDGVHILPKLPRVLNGCPHWQFLGSALDFQTHQTKLCSNVHVLHIVQSLGSNTFLSIHGPCQFNKSKEETKDDPFISLFLRDMRVPGFGPVSIPMSWGLVNSFK